MKTHFYLIISISMLLLFSACELPHSPSVPSASSEKRNCDCLVKMAYRTVEKEEQRIVEKSPKKGGSIKVDGGDSSALSLELHGQTAETVVTIDREQTNEYRITPVQAEKLQPSVSLLCGKLKVLCQNDSLGSHELATRQLEMIEEWEQEYFKPLISDVPILNGSPTESHSPKSGRYQKKEKASNPFGYIDHVQWSTEQLNFVFWPKHYLPDGTTLKLRVSDGLLNGEWVNYPFPKVYPIETQSGQLISLNFKQMDWDFLGQTPTTGNYVVEVSIAFPGEAEQIIDSISPNRPDAGEA